MLFRFLFLLPNKKYIYTKLLKDRFKRCEFFFGGVFFLQNISSVKRFSFFLYPSSAEQSSQYHFPTGGSANPTQA